MDTRMGSVATRSTDDAAAEQASLRVVAAGNAASKPFAERQLEELVKDQRIK